jgi:multicomponent Na+:H+ antiporter subunit A
MLQLVMLGIYLLARLETLGEMPLPPANLWNLLGGLGLLASALLPWVSEETGIVRPGLSRWTALQSVNLLVLLAGISDPSAAVATLLLAINLPLSVGLLALSEGELPGRPPQPDLRARWAWLVMRWLAVGSLLGVPPTLGFAGRWAAYRALVETGAGLGLAVATLASVPLAAALFDITRAEARVLLRAEGTRESQDVTADNSGGVTARWAWLVGPALLAVPLLVLGLYPPLVHTLTRTAASDPAGLSLVDVLRAPSAGATVGIVVALLLPLAAGYMLSRSGRMQQLEAGRLGQGVYWLADRLTLDWAYGLARRTGRPAGAALAVLVAPFRGERYMSWTLLLAVVLLLLLLGR